MTCPICNAPVALLELHPDGSLTDLMWQCGGTLEFPCDQPRPSMRELLTSGIQTYVIDIAGTVPVIAANIITAGRYCLPRFENQVGGVFQ